MILKILKRLRMTLSRKKNNAGRLQLVTMGCSKNRVDSEHIMMQLQAAGFEIAPENEDLAQGAVDTVVINTCGFIKDAKLESIDAIFAAVDAKQRGLVKRVFVFGCLSQRYRDELVAEIPEVDAFFGVSDYEDLVHAIGADWDSSLDESRFVTTPRHYAYLKISEGCDRKCSYCSIPGIRGKHKSVPMEKLLCEARNLASAGVKELIVIAQDTTYYGLDLYGERKLGELLKRLSEIEGIEWIRLHYSYPAGFPDDVIDIMSGNPKVCKYLDIPLQHISSKVLRLMRRSIDGPQTKALVRRFRERIPGIVLRTTMIVGHPGEDRREFEKLLSFVKEASFERLGAFTYSEEEGTYGAANLKDTVRESTKQKRYDELMEAQSAVSYDFNNSRIGTEEYVIIDSFSGDVFVTRSMYESPEVDGEVLVGLDTLDPSGKVFVYDRISDGTGKYVNASDIVADPLQLIGKFVKVSVTGADEYDLIAKFI